jgi:phosphatidylserine decarboxylase
MENSVFRSLRHGWYLVAPMLVIAAILRRWFPRLAIVLTGFTGLVALTFRDPDREITLDRNLALAPADGRIMRVEKIHDDYWKTDLIEIAIFLAIWDVHIQRVPYDGTIVGQTRKKGANRPAMTNAAAKLNNQILTYIDTPRGPMTVNQITGMVARRLVNWTPVGTPVRQGERLGMIVLGSQVTLHVPVESEILVQPGDIVRGGMTPMARLR